MKKTKIVIHIGASLRREAILDISPDEITLKYIQKMCPDPYDTFIFYFEYYDDATR
jgi:hypothetical protein